ncbi:MAG: reverse transcriptase N-terminal domain-containing protein [Selenomonadaceae bacterium]|nr:reverse transcriptase N-terminal domain-containing protein [Selenomonadaceae bacterium]
MRAVTQSGLGLGLYWLLTHSFYGRALAVKRVTENKGNKTAGVDHGLWTTPNQKFDSIFKLKRRNYQPSPLKRIYINKKNGKKRPLSIPTMLNGINLTKRGKEFMIVPKGLL